MDEELLKQIELLKGEHEHIVQLGKKMLEKIGVTEFTMFCASTLNRTLNLNRGFVTLMESSNYNAAAPLVRISLDSLLRFFASTQSEYDHENFAIKVRTGMQIDKMRARDTKVNLTDAELVRRMTKSGALKWVKTIYKIGSGFVHLSRQHLNTSFKREGDKIIGVISIDDSIIPTEEKTAAVNCMLKISWGIRISIGGCFEVPEDKIGPG